MQDSPHPRQGQEGRHLRFLPSWDSRFPLGEHGEICRAETMGERPYCSSSVGAANGRPFLNRRCSSCFLTATQIGGSTLGAA